MNMDKWMTKRNVLIISSLYIFCFAAVVFISTSCSSDTCKIREDSSLVVSLYALFPLAVVFIFSLVTYFMREEVFRTWWNFARWMVPVVIIATFTVNAVPKEHGFFSMNGLIYLVLIAPLYAIFILASLILITYKSYKLRGK